MHHIVAWLSGNSPTKNHEDRPRALNSRGIGLKIAISDQYLNLAARKRLKIDYLQPFTSYSEVLVGDRWVHAARCVCPALNLLSIHVTFTAIDQGRTQAQGRPKCAKKSHVTLASASPDEFLVNNLLNSMIANLRRV